MIDKSGLLTIQKFVYLLDEFHYQEFCSRLESAGAALPLKLVQSIRKKLPEFDTHEKLCVAVYGSFKQKQNFNQLSSYTFKLSYLLSQNYPGYLHQNVTRIEQLVNQGNVSEANFRADCLVDIAHQVEDFLTLASVLKILTQQAFLTRDATLGFKLSTRLEEALQNERLCGSIIAKLRQTLYAHSEKNASDKLKQLKDFYHPFHIHPTASIRILSQYAYLYTVYYFNPGMYNSTSDVKLIESLEKELTNNSQVIFPFLFDIKGIFGFLLLNSPLMKGDSAEAKRHFKELSKHYNSVKFWNNYLNMPQIFSIAVQATRFVSTYHYLVHRSDYQKLMPAADQKLMKELSDKCAELIDLDIWEKQYKNDLVSVKMLYGALLVLKGGDRTKQGIETLESLLTSYQQMNLSGSTDSIFLSLMIGYFSVKKYDRCSETYKRYLKVIKDKPVYEGNDISIHTYYYLSRWIETESKQYLAKLEANYKRSKGTGGPQRAMEELLAYFEVPVKLK
jgi:hypothetical protein